MPDKLKEMEERLDKLENRLKVTFLEIEKRFESFKQEQPIGIEDRLQELEDLLLLIQLEVSKLKDRTSIDFGIGAPAPDISERLSKLEEAVLGEHFTGEEAHEVSTYAELEHRIELLEERISLHHRPYVEGKPDTSKQLDELEKRLERLEKRRTEKVVVEHSNALEDVRKILHA